MQKFKWTDKSIKLLITLRFKRDGKFIKPNCKKNKLWTQLAKDMFDKGRYHVSGLECDQKFRNLMQTFKKNKNKQKTSGESSIVWPYFKVFNDFFGNKICISPPKEILGSTMISQEEEDESQSDAENKCKSTTRKRKSEMIDWKQKYLEAKLQRKKDNDERAIKKWEEQKEVENERTKALVDLNKTLMEYNQIKLRELNYNNN